MDPDGRSVFGKLAGYGCYVAAGIVLVGGIAVTTTGQIYLTAGAVELSLALAASGASVLVADTLNDAQKPSNVGNSLKQKAQAPVTAAGSPAPNDGNGGKHGKDDHDDAINQKVKEVKQSGGKNIRKNQQQVDASGKRVGKNRPDVQWDDKDGKHHCWEVDHNPKSSANHGAVISSNDPNAIVELVIIK